MTFSPLCRRRSFELISLQCNTQVHGLSLNFDRSAAAHENMHKNHVNWIFTCFHYIRYSVSCPLLLLLLLMYCCCPHWVLPYHCHQIFLAWHIPMPGKMSIDSGLHNQMNWCRIYYVGIVQSANNGVVRWLPMCEARFFSSSVFCLLVLLLSMDLCDSIESVKTFWTIDFCFYYLFACCRTTEKIIANFCLHFMACSGAIQHHRSLCEWGNGESKLERNDTNIREEPIATTKYYYWKKIYRQIVAKRVQWI